MWVLLHDMDFHDKRAIEHPLHDSKFQFLVGHATNDAGAAGLFEQRTYNPDTIGTMQGNHTGGFHCTTIARAIERGNKFLVVLGVTADVKQIEPPRARYSAMAQNKGGSPPPEAAEYGELGQYAWFEHEFEYIFYKPSHVKVQPR